MHFITTSSFLSAPTPYCYNFLAYNSSSVSAKPFYMIARATLGTQILDFLSRTKKETKKQPANQSAKLVALWYIARLYKGEGLISQDESIHTLLFI